MVAPPRAPPGTIKDNGLPNPLGGVQFPVSLLWVEAVRATSASPSTVVVIPLTLAVMDAPTANCGEAGSKGTTVLTPRQSCNMHDIPPEDVVAVVSQPSNPVATR